MAEEEEYKDSYNYNNYPELNLDSLKGDSIGGGNLHHGIDGELGESNAIEHPLPGAAGVGSNDDHPAGDKMRARFNRAHMNVDQYNYLAGRINSVAKVKPYTFNDYYELYPYTSGEFIVPRELYSVEFKIDAPEVRHFEAVADNLAEAKARLFYHEIPPAAQPDWLTKTLYWSESGKILSTEDDIIYYEGKTLEVAPGHFNQAVGGTKSKVYNFLVMHHNTGWSVKRNPHGYEEWEDEAWLNNDGSFYEESLEPNSGDGYGIGDGPFATDPRGYDGSKVIGVAQRLGIPIKNHTDLPDDYIATLEKHGADLDIGTNVYDIQVTKSDIPIMNGSHSLPSSLGLPDNNYEVRGTMGFLNTDYGSHDLKKWGQPDVDDIPETYAQTWCATWPDSCGGYGPGGVYTPAYYAKHTQAKHTEMAPSTNMEVFLSHTDTFTKQALQLTFASDPPMKDVRMYDHYKQSGVHWNDSEVPEPCPNCGALAGRAPESRPLGEDPENKPSLIAQHQGVALSKYTFFDRMPDYFMNHHYRIFWGEKGWAADGGGDLMYDAETFNQYVWNAAFYDNNDIYTARGYGKWSVGPNDLKNSSQVAPDMWSRYWPGAGSLGSWHNNMLTGCEDEWRPYPDPGDALGKIEKCVEDNGGAGWAWKNILAGYKVGYNQGEVYQRSLLKAKHLMINKPQHARVSDEDYDQYRAIPDGEVMKRFSEMQEHTESYHLLPYPTVKNTSYGVETPALHTMTAGNTDPNYLNDQHNRYVSTDWISIEDVKDKAEEMGFLFESRRLSVPFRLLEFDFSIGDPKALARPSGECIYHNPLGTLYGDFHPFEAENAYLPAMASGINFQGAAVGNAALNNNYWFYTGVHTAWWLGTNGYRNKSPIENPLSKMWQQFPIPWYGADDPKNIPWPSDIIGSAANTAFAIAAGMLDNISNAIYYDNYSTPNPIFWVDEGAGLHAHDDGTTPAFGAETFRCAPPGGTCAECIDYRNIFGGDAHAGDGCADTYGLGEPGWPSLGHNVIPCPDGLCHEHFTDVGDCFECEPGHAKLDGVDCIECPRFVSPDTDLDGPDLQFLELKGNANGGVFNFTSTGYTPFLNSMKMFVWSDTVADADWVKPVGIGTRYIYRYRTDDFYEMYKIDSVKEQLIHADEEDPYRIETKSSWLGNYIYAAGHGDLSEEYGRSRPYYGQNTIDAPSRVGYLEPISGTQSHVAYDGQVIDKDPLHGGGPGYQNTLMPNMQLIPTRDKRSQWPWGEGDGLDVDHYKIVWHLGLLHYHVQPILPITIVSASSASEYKNWMLNIQERLYPAYYMFQENSSEKLSKNHAAFAYIEPDIYYEDFKVANFAPEFGATTDGQWTIESGMMITSLDVFDGHFGRMGSASEGISADSEYNGGGDEYWLGFPPRYAFNDGVFNADGDGRAPHPWALGGHYGAMEGGRGGGLAWEKNIIKDNSVPSIFTDFVPKKAINVSGGCWKSMAFIDGPGDMGFEFFDFQGDLDGFNPPKGTKIALQFYIDNTIDRDAGEVGGIDDGWPEDPAGPSSLTCWDPGQST